MTYKEANNIIDDITWTYNGQSITPEMIDECRHKCHEVLERQIPKTPRISVCGNMAPYGDFLFIDDDWEYMCPSCKNCEIDYPDNRCVSCGQVLDWTFLDDWYLPTNVRLSINSNKERSKEI